MLKYFAIYNTTTSASEDPGNRGTIDDKLTEKVYNLINGKEKEVGVINLSKQRELVLGNECVGRGTLSGEWKVYAEYEPFDWANLVGDRVLSATAKAEYDKAVLEAARKAAAGGEG